MNIDIKQLLLQNSDHHKKKLKLFFATKSSEHPQQFLDLKNRQTDSRRIKIFKKLCKAASGGNRQNFDDSLKALDVKILNFFIQLYLEI